MNTRRMTGMFACAQTIVQLYRQLQNEGRPVSDVEHVRRAYELAQELFTCRVQPSGKLYLSHAVGTASILCAIGQPAQVAAAGLLHNVYAKGDFGDGQSGVTEARRDEVRHRVGTEVEGHIHRFGNLEFGREQLHAIAQSPESVDEAGRTAFVILMAESLEKYLDGGVFYQPSFDGRIRFAERDGPVLVRLAQAWGQPRLAEMLAKTLCDLRVEPPPDVLRMEGHPWLSKIVMPPSYRHET